MRAATGSPRTDRSRAGRLAIAALPVVALVAVALNQRPAVASIGPVLGEIRRSLHLSGTAAAVLTAAPVVCFGVLAPAGSWLAQRVGINRAVGLLSAVLLAGLVLRLGPDTATLFAGTIVAAGGIAAMNVLLPALVRLEWPARTGLMMGVYTTGLTGAAALAAGLTVPLQHVIGGGWRSGLAPWAVLGAIGLVGWLPQVRRDRLAGPPADPSPADPHPLTRSPQRNPSTDTLTGGERVSRDSAGGERVSGEPAGGERVPRAAAAPRPVELRRDRIAWLVTGYFGLQSAGFYAVLTWLPTLFTDHGVDAATAGGLLSLCTLVQTPVALVTPALAARARRQSGLVLVSSVAAVLGFALLLIAPVGAAYPAVVVLGVGQGMSFPLSLTILVLRAPTPESTTRLSSMAQTIGYLLAALGPLLVGLLHSASGGWTVPVLFLSALLAPQALCGALAGRPRRT